MNIMVFDVPAESVGALSILNDFYNEFKADKSNNYIVVVSKPELKETKNIRVLRFPWIKKSWFHRLYFDYFIAPKLVDEYKADEILSLQNVIIPKVRVKQILYLQNSLPFIAKRFKLLESPILWMYQNIIGKKMIKSIEKADQIIVQTMWMKNACVNKAKVKPEKIIVIPPKMNIKTKREFKSTIEHRRTFFYPASGFIYKNHKVVVDAAILLKERGIRDYKIIFTLKGDENKHIIRLYKQVKENNIPIDFIGTITQEQVFDYYSQSILLFPSYVETVGLPMLEAKLHKTPVIASDCSFSHEILNGYEKVSYFDEKDALKLANIMGKILKNYS